MSKTIVFLHAHPDDEALLTAGTMARASAEGHRVVLITATKGEAGLADDSMQGSGLGEIRSAELQTSARILGVSRLEMLGYADSGLHGEADPVGAITLVQAPMSAVAAQVTDIVRAERADTLVTYDCAGGYGHPDHVAVHRAGLAAAKQVPGISLFAATAPREPFAWGVRIAERVAKLPADFDPNQYLNAFTPRSEITNRVDVSAYLDFKRAAMRAHASQATGGNVRTLAAMLRLPRPLFRQLLGTEHYLRLT